MNIMAILKAIKTIGEIVIPFLGYLGKHKAKKQAEKVEKITSAVIKGVETYQKAVEDCKGSVMATPLLIKQIIKNKAEELDVQDELDALVKKFTK